MRIGVNWMGKIGGDSYENWYELDGEDRWR